MPRYVVERTFPGGLRMPTNDEGAEACECIIANNARDGVTWIHSYVTQDLTRTYCICDAPSPEAIREASRSNNLPVDRITAVSVLDPHFYYAAWDAPRPL